MDFDFIKGSSEEGREWERQRQTYKEKRKKCKKRRKWKKKKREENLRLMDSKIRTGNKIENACVTRGRCDDKIINNKKCTPQPISKKKERLLVLHLIYTSIAASLGRSFSESGGGGRERGRAEWNPLQDLATDLLVWACSLWWSYCLFYGEMTRASERETEHRMQFHFGSNQLKA